MPIRLSWYNKYSLRPEILVLQMDVSKIILVIDTYNLSILRTKISPPAGEGVHNLNGRPRIPLFFSCLSDTCGVDDGLDEVNQ